MISKRTVFVVGAGASVPFEFPTGRGLVTEVLVHYRNGNSRQFLEKECGFPRQTLSQFHDALLRSGKNSVDAFLEHRLDLLDVGKAAIAYALIQKETEEQLFNLGNENWLRYVYDHMNCSFEEFGANPISFVVFNYDRAIEHFLHSALCNTYKKSLEEGREQLSRIPIVHLHGRLGHLPWQASGGRSYDGTLNCHTLSIAKEGIKIIHEDPKGNRDEDFQTAKNLLEDAEQVCFLGFGFDETNVNRLELGNLRGGRHILATAYGFTRTELNDKYTLTKNKITLHNDTDCISLLRNNLQW